MKISRKDIISAFELLGDKTREIVYFCGDIKKVKSRIKISRRQYKDNRFNKDTLELVVTIGKPNDKERKYLKRRNPSKVLVKEIKQ